MAALKGNNYSIIIFRSSSILVKNGTIPEGMVPFDIILLILELGR